MRKEPKIRSLRYPYARVWVRQKRIGRHYYLIFCNINIGLFCRLRRRLLETGRDDLIPSRRTRCISLTFYIFAQAGLFLFESGNLFLRDFGGPNPLLSPAFPTTLFDGHTTTYHFHCFGLTEDASLYVGRDLWGDIV